MKKRVKHRKTILEYLCEFHWTKALFVLAVGFMFFIIGKTSPYLSFNDILMINISYLFGVYVPLTIAYNLSKGLPLLDIKSMFYKNKGKK
jgi:hypothetical protein